MILYCEVFFLFHIVFLSIKSQSSATEIDQQDGFQEPSAGVHALPDAIPLQQLWNDGHAETARAEESSRSSHSALPLSFQLVLPLLSLFCCCFLYTPYSPLSTVMSQSCIN